MNLHEYQAKKILKRYGIPIPEYRGRLDVSKRRAHRGGAPSEGGGHEDPGACRRPGKGGRGQVREDERGDREDRKALIGMKMVNQQTGPEGVVAKKDLDFKADRNRRKSIIWAPSSIGIGRCPLLIASPEGGMEIEEIAQKTPEKILKMPFGFDGKLRPYQLLRLDEIHGMERRIGQKGGAHCARACEVLHRDRCVASGDQSARQNAARTRSSRSMRN